MLLHNHSLPNMTHPIKPALLLALATLPCAAQTAHKPAPAADPEHAISLAENGHCQEALPLLPHAAAHLTDKAQQRKALLDGAKCANVLQNWDSLSEFARLLSQQFPHDPDVLYGLVHAYNDLSSRAARELAMSPPDTLPVYELDAETNEAQGKWDDAEEEYKKILAKDPHYPGIHFRMARLILSKPNPPADFKDQAKKELDQELAIDPTNAGAEFVLGELAQEDTNYDEAIHRFRRATDLEPNFGEAWLGLGTCLLQQSKYAEALAPLEHAVKFDPLNPAVRYSLGTAYARTGHAAEAQQQFAELQKLQAAVRGGTLGGKLKQPD